MMDFFFRRLLRAVFLTVAAALFGWTRPALASVLTHESACFFDLPAIVASFHEGGFDRQVSAQDTGTSAVQTAGGLLHKEAVESDLLPGMQCWTQIRDGAFFEDSAKPLDGLHSTIAFLFSKSSKDLSPVPCGSQESAGNSSSTADSSARGAVKGGLPPLNDDDILSRNWIADALTVADTGAVGSYGASGSVTGTASTYGQFTGGSGGGSGASATRSAVFASSASPAPVPLPSPLWGISVLFLFIFARQRNAPTHLARFAYIR
jgi:hypothetical protein